MQNGAPDAAARQLARSPNGRRPHLLHQRWESLLFLHWRLPAARVQQTLPPGLTVDTFNGDAYLAIVPFFMRNIRPVGLPAVPWISHFLELNVRTYAYDREGVPGVWFYSLDCNQPIAVLAARQITGLRYLHARMSAQRGDLVDYACQRRGTEQVARYRYRSVGEPRLAAPDSLEFFLLERYYLFAQHRGALVRGQVTHAPYEFRGAQLEQFSILPAHLDGLREIEGAPMHVCVSDGFDVKTYGIEKISSANSCGS